MTWWRFFVAVVFWVQANRYFGWHWTPQSDAELLADGIFMLLLALSVPSQGDRS